MSSKRAVARRRRLQAFYAPFLSESDVRLWLGDLHAGKGAFAPLSWREIVQLPILNQFNFATLADYAEGRASIKNPEHRFIFGLPALVEIEPCPTCGGACTFDCGKQRIVALPGTKRKRNRATVNLNNRKSIAETLNSKLDKDQIKELIFELSEILRNE